MLGGHDGEEAAANGSRVGEGAVAVGAGGVGHCGGGVCGVCGRMIFAERGISILRVDTSRYQSLLPESVLNGP